MRPKYVVPLQSEVDFSSPYVMDDFLPPEEFEAIRSLVCNENEDVSFGFFLHKFVSSSTELDDQSLSNNYWNWYGTHMLYDDNQPTSSRCGIFYNLIVKKFYDMEIISALIRIKANFYPWTETIREHLFHADYPYKNNGALFSINTCDGYTEFEDGTKIDSVANRMMLFNPSIPHRSTTTTNAFGRFNINFNFT